VSAVKARWHVDLDQLGAGVPDLWAEEVEATGLPIDLTTTVARLTDELLKTGKKEGYLDSCGITCAIKDRPDTSCWACPLYAGDVPDDPRGSLCIVGREQERITTRLVVARMEEEQEPQGETEGPDTAP
jgi:hypothetical protein